MDDLALREAEASASLAGLYGSLDSDDSDEDDEDYVRCYLRHHLCIRDQPMMMRPAMGSGVAREDTLLPITTNQSTATPAVPDSFVEIR